MILFVVDKDEKYPIDVVQKDDSVIKVAYDDFLKELANSAFLQDISYPVSLYYCKGDEGAYDILLTSIVSDTAIDAIISFGSDPYKVLTSSSLMSSRIKKPTVLESFFEKKQFELQTEHGNIPYWASVNPNNFTRGQNIKYLDYQDRYNRLTDLIISVMSYLNVKKNYE